MGTNHPTLNRVGKKMKKLSYAAPEVTIFKAEELDAIVATMSGGGGGRPSGGSSGGTSGGSSGGSSGRPSSPHQDCLYCPEGALWTCVTAPSYVNPYGSYTKSVWYVPKQYISSLIDVISQDQYLNTMELLAKGTIAVSQAAADFYLKSADVKKVFADILKTVGALKAFYELFGSDPFAFSDQVISSIRKNAGGTEGGALYSNGVKLTIQYLYYTGLLQYSAVKWNGSPYLYGPQNHHGKWCKNETMFSAQ